MRLGLGLSIGNQNQGPRTITADTPPALAELSDGDTLSMAVTWGSYASAEGSIITPTTREVSINGGAFAAYNGATTVSSGETYQLREIVADSEGNSRTFYTGKETIAIKTALGTPILDSNGELILEAA